MSRSDRSQRPWWHRVVVVGGICGVVGLLLYVMRWFIGGQVETVRPVDEGTVVVFERGTSGRGPPLYRLVLLDVSTGEVLGRALPRRGHLAGVAPGGVVWAPSRAGSWSDAEPGVLFFDRETLDAVEAPPELETVVSMDTADLGGRLVRFETAARDEMCLDLSTGLWERRSHADCVDPDPEEPPFEFVGVEASTRSRVSLAGRESAPMLDPTVLVSTDEWAIVREGDAAAGRTLHRLDMPSLETRWSQPVDDPPVGAFTLGERLVVFGRTSVCSGSTSPPARSCGAATRDAPSHDASDGLNDEERRRGPVEDEHLRCVAEPGVSQLR